MPDAYWNTVTLAVQNVPDDFFSILKDPSFFSNLGIPQNFIYAYVLYKYRPDTFGCNSFNRHNLCIAQEKVTTGICK